jgi:CheY-like chemotaxis protein
MGKLNLELTLVDIWHLLETIRDEFHVAALDRDVKITLDLSPLVCTDSRSRHSKKLSTKTADSMTDLPINVRFFKVVADEVRMQQVLRNLISNALKFSRPDGNLIIRVDKKTIPKRKRKAETVSLCTGASPTVTQVGNILINVNDDGVGMTPDQVKTVFDEGTQFNANRFQAGGGSGLGLNIARGIVVQHGGHLTCTSSGPGKGTTFTIDLPIYDLHSAEVSGDSVDAQLGGHSHLDTQSQFIIEEEDSCHNDGPIGDDARRKGRAQTIPEEGFSENEAIIPQLRILVVDDSFTNRKFCMRLLERKGHTTEGACDGKAAVHMVEASLQNGENYDCILLDYEMPHLRGPEACKKMREMGCSSFIVGVTGNVMSDDVNHFRNCGANWVLPKPFRLEALEEQLIEHDVVPPMKTDQEKCIFRVQSVSRLVEMGDPIALDMDSGTSSANSSSARSDFE